LPLVPGSKNGISVALSLPRRIFVRISLEDVERRLNLR